MKKLDRPTFIVILAAIAVALLFAANTVTATAGSGSVVACIALMAAFCIGQYRYGKSFR